MGHWIEGGGGCLVIYSLQGTQILVAYETKFGPPPLVKKMQGVPPIIDLSNPSKSMITKIVGMHEVKNLNEIISLKDQLKYKKMNKGEPL